MNIAILLGRALLYLSRNAAARQTLPQYRRRVPQIALGYGPIYVYRWKVILKKDGFLDPQKCVRFYPRSEKVSKSLKMSENVWKGLKMSEKVWKCLKMSEKVSKSLKKSEKVWNFLKM